MSGGHRRDGQAGGLRVGRDADGHVAGEGHQGDPLLDGPRGQACAGMVGAGNECRVGARIPPIISVGGTCCLCHPFFFICKRLPEVIRGEEAGFKVRRVFCRSQAEIEGAGMHSHRLPL